METETVTLPHNLQEKKDYVERVEKKSADENISLKHACQKLGSKYWAYNKYKTELRKVDADRQRISRNDVKVEPVEKHGQVLPKTITLNVSDYVYSYLETESKEYAISADIVAQLLLHDCVKGKMAAKQKPEVKA